MVDTDGSERLKLELLGLGAGLAIPAGSTLSDGTHSFSITTANASAPIDLSGWDFSKLSLKPVAGFVGSFTLKLRATATEASNGSTASTTQALNVVVLPGTPVATPVGVSPYVSLLNGGVTVSTLTANTSAPAAAPTATAPPAQPAAAPPAGLPRTWAEEEAADQVLRKRQGDTWLRELELKAQAQWRAIVGLGVG